MRLRSSRFARDGCEHVAPERDMDQSTAAFRGNGLRNSLLQFELRLFVRSSL